MTTPDVDAAPAPDSEEPNYKAGIDDFDRRRVCVVVIRTGDGGTTEYLRQPQDDPAAHRRDEWSTDSPGYVLDVPNDVARAVYDALHARFGQEGATVSG